MTKTVNTDPTYIIHSLLIGSGVNVGRAFDGVTDKSDHFTPFCGCETAGDIRRRR